LNPTPEQLESRKTLAEFIERMGRPFRGLSEKVRSAWFSRPDEELQGWIERGRAISEIEDSLGYKLIMGQTEREIRWAQDQLEVCEESKVGELRLYLRSLRFLNDFILTTRRNADISNSVLAGRSSAIGRDTATFVKNARVEN
jgi:hypothetical protein